MSTQKDKVVYIDANGEQQLRDMTDAEQAELNARRAASAVPTKEQYVAAMETMYDTKAKEKHYDSRFTCALRAGYAGPFQAEGIAFATWMDTCNAQAYQIMAAVLTGQRTPPSISELLGELPTLSWPA